MEVKNLRAYLANIDMSLREFAEIVDCNYKYLSNVAGGKRPIGKRLAKEIRQATDGIVDLPVATKKKTTCHYGQQRQEQPATVG